MSPPTFDDLAQVLSDDEKKELLGQIQASLHLSDRDTDAIVSRAQEPGELRERLQKEWSRLGFVERWWIRVAAFLTSRSEHEIIADRRLLPTRTNLKTRVPELVHFQRGEWTAEMGRLIYDLYADAQGVKPVFDHLFQQKITLEAGFLALIEEEYPQAAHRLEDLFPEDEIAALYLEDPRRAPLRQELDRRLASALAKVPSGALDRARARVLPLYLLKPLVQYPYAYLLELFGHVPEKGDIVKYPYLMGAPWRKTAALLERLYYGLHLCARTDWRPAELDRIWRSVADRLGEGQGAWTPETVISKVSALVRTGQELATRLPWSDLLRWAFQDPYYGVKYILPKVGVREFYRSSLEIRFRQELDSVLPSVRRRLLQQEKAILFPRAQFGDGLEYYSPGASVSLASAHKLQGFIHADEVGLLWSFLNLHHLKKIAPFHQSLVRLIPAGNKALLQGLTTAVEDLTALRQRLQALERSLHPDTEEGKVFHKLRYELTTKALGLKPFVDLLSRTDEEAEACVERGLEILQSLHQHLSGLRERNVPALKSLLALPYLLEGQQESIENGLDRLIVIVKKTLFVLRETVSLEA